MESHVKYLKMIVASLGIILFTLCPSLSQAESAVVGFIASGKIVDDDSFNWMTVTGLNRLKRKFDIKVEVRHGGFSYDEFKKETDSLLADNATIVIINSSNNHQKIAEYISNHPEVIFIMNDARIDGYKNLSSISYGQCMGSCLVGALCAWQTQTGKVGFIGGNEHHVIKDFLDGFRQGVQLSGRDVDIVVQFIRKGVSAKGYEDPKQANMIARGMYASGVDIIYSVAGLSGNGVIQAASKTGNYVVGVDSDQDFMAKGTVLTSMMKRLDVAVYNEVLSVLEGRFSPGIKEYDLSNNGVGLTEMKYTEHLISSDVKRRLSELKEQLATGAIRLDCKAK